MRTITACLLTATLGLGLACAPKPGDYRVYRVTALAEQADEGCPGGTFPEDGDSSTFFGASTLAIFASDADTYFLEFLGTAITGTREGAEFAFAGDSIDVQDNMAFTTRLTRTLDVSLEIHGKEITGSYVSVEKLVCEGTCPADIGYTCTKTNEFFGSEVDDVELEYGLGGAGAP